jgi:hypothetical protein
MVNKTLLPPGQLRTGYLTPYRIGIFSTGTGFAEVSVNRGLGEQAVRTIRNRAWESSARIN